MPSTPGNVFTLAVETWLTVRHLLGGTDRARRLGGFVWLAVMAGLVGAGLLPPPLGMALPFWEDPVLRAATFDQPGVIGILGFSAVFLLAVGGIARAFAFSFLEGIVHGKPQAFAYRRWLRSGGAHFVWSGALSLPLYALLFGGEALVARDAHQRMIAAFHAPYLTETQLALQLLGVGAKFLLVLLPWAILTLPVLALLYELTPAMMVRTGQGPSAACRRILADIPRRPRFWLTYAAFRLVCQLIGNTLALWALLPGLLVAAIPGAPILLLGLSISNGLGGTATQWGAGTLGFAGAISLAFLYVSLCIVLLPVALFLNTLALKAAAGVPAE